MKIPGGLLAAVALAVTVCALPAAAQKYPERTIRVVVPFSAGGATDLLARIINPKLQQALGQQLIIDNRPGGGANIGAEYAARQAPDGYTLLMVTISHSINVSVYKNLQYDLVRDFSPVTLMAVTPHILVVHPSLPVKSVKELMAFAQARPGQLDYASSGSGSSAHLAAELFNTMARVKMVHIPYKGGGPAVIGLISGEASVGFPTLPSVLRYVQSGRVRALAIATGQRSASTPDLPTVGEAGLPGYDVGSWFGLLVPAGTPKEIVSRLNAETVRVLRLPEVAERLNAAGFEVRGTTPAEYAAFKRSEIEKWAKVVKTAGARVD
jgi:tripartite-type tricarboxylate transporter receptor subunit TctC